MARNQHTFAKRQREMEKKRKADEKRARRRKKKEETDAATDTPDGDEAEVDKVVEKDIRHSNKFSSIR